MTSALFHRAPARLLAVAVATILGATVFSTPAEAAPNIACGAHLTTNTTLTANLSCTGDGVTLDPGVTLDLGGHRLSGKGTGTGVQALGTTALSVVNGTLSNWSVGIQVSGNEDTLEPAIVRLSGVTITKAPLNLQIATITIDKSALCDSPIQLWVTTLTITNSTLRRSSTLGEMNHVDVQKSRVIGGGVGLDENNSVSLTDSVFDGTGSLVPVVCGTATITRSTVKNYTHPVADNCGEGLTIVDSTFRNNPNGAILAGGSVSISGSTFRKSGVAVTAYTATVSNSTFVGNSTGILLAAADGSTSTIASSTFRYNSGSGIYTDGTGLALGGNTAVRNGVYGIHAPGAVDLGGNVARKNGATDCVGLVCATY